MRWALVVLVALLAVAATSAITREEFDALGRRVRGLDAEVKMLSIRVKHLERGESPARPQGNRKAAPAPERQTKGIEGPLSIGHVFPLPPGVESYPLYADEAARREFQKLARADDMHGLALMALGGRYALLTPGVRVRVIQVHGFLDQRIEVRVLDGPCAGESGLIDMHLLAQDAR